MIKKAQRRQGGADLQSLLKALNIFTKLFWSSQPDLKITITRIKLLQELTYLKAGQNFYFRVF